MWLPRQLKSEKVMIMCGKDIVQHSYSINNNKSCMTTLESYLVTSIKIEYVRNGDTDL